MTNLIKSLRESRLTEKLQSGKALGMAGEVEGQLQELGQQLVERFEYLKNRLDQAKKGLKDQSLNEANQLESLLDGFGKAFQKTLENCQRDLKAFKE